MKSKWLSKNAPHVYLIMNEHANGVFEIIDANNESVVGIKYASLDEFLRVEAALQLYQDITFKDQLLNKYTNINKLDKKCIHEYKEYNGFTMRYKYCIHCEDKNYEV